MSTTPFRLVALSLAAGLLSPLLVAQDATLNALGASAGQALYSTHMAVNTLGDAWMAKVYENNKALQIAGSYEGGAKAMRDALTNMMENTAKITGDDRKFITGMVESCDLLLAQITAFKGYVKTGDKEMAGQFEAKRVEAQKKIFGLLGIEGGAADSPGGGGARDLAFQIIKSTLPGGKPGRLGSAKFAREAEDRAFGVSWQYENGGKDSGVGVPYPESGVIAVGFGPDVLGVALYKLDGDTVDARWAAYEPGAEIGSYVMKQGSDKTLFNIEGGGSIRIKQGRERTAQMEWELASGNFTGIAVAEGNYLAAVSLKPGGKGGVAIYTADVQNGSAAGRWTMTGASGAGEEQLQLVSANGQKMDAQGGGDPAAEVRAIAESLRQDAASVLAKLRPTEEQVEAIAANAAAAKQLNAYVDKVYSQLGEIGQVAKPGQTEIQVTSGDGLPGGYQQQAANFRPGIQIYGFEYLEPGKTAGMAYDGVVNVGGRWVMIPKMWRAFAQ